MLRGHFCSLLLLCVAVCVAQTAPLSHDTVRGFGTEARSSEFFREWYQYGELQHYLDNYSDYVVYEAETTGEWALPEQMVFSVHGNSFRWNRYYLNDFRIDSRFLAGSTLFQLDMMEQSLALDYHRGALHFATDSVRPNKISLSGNVGGLGGLAPGTKEMLEWQHAAAVSRLYLDEALTTRMHQIGGGQADFVYGIPAFGRQFYQHVYANYGRRQQLKLDYQGLCGTYDTDYYKVQIDGELPLPDNRVVDRLNYIVSAQKRGDMFAEFMYNDNEVATQVSHSVSLYGTKNYDRHGRLTTGLTFAHHKVRHNELEFTRNVVDQDGEAFEPWYADGQTSELNWSVNYDYRIVSWLDFKIDAYNSLMHFTPSTTKWHNDITFRRLNDDDYTPLYRYEWSSAAFTSGMLENTFSLNAHKQMLPWLTLQGMVAFTLDGMLLKDKSLVTPSWEASVGIHIEPTKWFAMDVVLANYRTRYSYNDILYMSNDYLNGTLNYASGDFLTTTGGACHQWGDRLMQPQYFMIDLPFKFTFGRHEISVLNSLKKYYNTWTTRFANEAEALQAFTAIDVTEDGYDGSDYQVFAMNPAERRYVVECEGAVGSNFLFNTPLFASNLIKYTYNGQKVFFSFGWQSYCVSGTSALGNGVLANNIGILSESTASPNSALNNANMAQKDAGVRRLGRNDQDRAFIARLQLGVNITSNWQLSLSGKFKDGTPFTNYRTTLYTDAAGNRQVVVWNADTKGDNTVDAHFGKREDSFFNFDIRLRYRGLIRGVLFSAEAICYNFWDFGTALGEYTFDYNTTTGTDVPGNRYALQLCVPRGLIVKLCVGLDKQ